MTRAHVLSILPIAIILEIPSQWPIHRWQPAVTCNKIGGGNLKNVIVFVSRQDAIDAPKTVDNKLQTAVPATITYSAS